MIEKSFHNYAFRFLRNDLLSKFPLVDDLWPRNSFLEKHFHPLKSDLDLTIALKTEASNSLRLELISYLNKVKCGIPFLGEAHLIWPKLIEKTKCSFNPVEIQRDPILCQKFSISPKSIQRLDGQIFFHRTLIFQKRSLLAGSDPFQMRPKKFQTYSHYIQEDFSSIEDIFSFLDYQGTIGHFFKFTELVKHPERDLTSWMKNLFEEGQFNRDYISSQSFSHPQKKKILKQISWEKSHSLLYLESFSGENIDKHFENLDLVTNALQK